MTPPSAPSVAPLPDAAPRAVPECTLDAAPDRILVCAADVLVLHSHRLARAIVFGGLDPAADATLFDVVLLDLGLPDPQGFDTFRRVQQAAPNVPVVVLTASGNDDLALRTLREGAQDYLVKGGTGLPDLLRAMRNSLVREQAGLEAVVRTRDDMRRKKMAALDALLAGVTHEVNNPLTLVAATPSSPSPTLDDALADPDVPPRLHGMLADARAHLEKVRGASEMLAMVSGELERVVRARATVRGDSDLALVVERALGLLHRELDGIRVDLDLRPCRLLLDEDAMLDAIGRVLRNACEALAEAPEKRIDIRIQTEAARVVVTIVDTCPGVPWRLRPLAFDPFVTTKHGNLGLTTVQAVVRSHGGEIHLGDREGRNTLVELRLTLARPGDPPSGVSR